MRTAHSTFSEAFAEHARFDGEVDAATKMISAVRDIEREFRFKKPEDLLEKVRAWFKDYSSPSSDWCEPGPWASFIVCSEIDSAGALRLCANVIRAELEGVMPKTRWTEP